MAVALDAVAVRFPVDVLMLASTEIPRRPEQIAALLWRTAVRLVGLPEHATRSWQEQLGRFALNPAEQGAVVTGLRALVESTPEGAKSIASWAKPLRAALTAGAAAQAPEAAALTHALLMQALEVLEQQLSVVPARTVLDEGTPESGSTGRPIPAHEVHSSRRAVEGRPITRDTHVAERPTGVPMRAVLQARAHAQEASVPQTPPRQGHSFQAVAEGQVVAAVSQELLDPTGRLALGTRGSLNHAQAAMAEAGLVLSEAALVPAILGAHPAAAPEGKDLEGDALQPLTERPAQEVRAATRQLTVMQSDPGLQNSDAALGLEHLVKGTSVAAGGWEQPTAATSHRVTPHSDSLRSEGADRLSASTNARTSAGVQQWSGLVPLALSGRLSPAWIKLEWEHVDEDAGKSASKPNAQVRPHLLSLHFDDDQFGRMAFHLAWLGHEVSGTVVADRPEAAEWVRAKLPELERGLRAAGCAPASFRVLLHHDPFEASGVGGGRNHVG